MVYDNSKLVIVNYTLNILPLRPLMVEWGLQDWDDWYLMVSYFHLIGSHPSVDNRRVFWQGSVLPVLPTIL